MARVELLSPHMTFLPDRLNLVSPVPRKFHAYEQAPSIHTVREALIAGADPAEISALMSQDPAKFDKRHYLYDPVTQTYTELPVTKDRLRKLVFAHKDGDPVLNIGHGGNPEIRRYLSVPADYIDLPQVQPFEAAAGERILSGDFVAHPQLQREHYGLVYARNVMFSEHGMSAQLSTISSILKRGGHAVLEFSIANMHDSDIWQIPSRVRQTPRLKVTQMLVSQTASTAKNPAYRAFDTKLNTVFFVLTKR